MRSLMLTTLSISVVGSVIYGAGSMFMLTQQQQMMTTEGKNQPLRLPLIDSSEETHNLLAEKGANCKVTVFSNGKLLKPTSQLDLGVLVESQNQIDDHVVVTVECDTISKGLPKITLMATHHTASGNIAEKERTTTNYISLYRLRSCFGSGQPFTASLDEGNHVLKIHVELYGLSGQGLSDTLTFLMPVCVRVF